MTTVIGVLTCILGVALPASAQQVCAAPCVNPTGLTFDASADHNSTGLTNVTSYAVEYWLPGATQPVQSISIGKPTPDASGTIAVDLRPMNRPISVAATYTIKVAVAGNGGTAKSLDSGPFSLAADKPSAPQKPPVLIK